MLKKRYFWIAVLWTIVITVLSLISSSGVPSVRKIPNIDKLVHFIFYFFFTVTWYLCFNTRDSDRLNKKVLFVSCIVAFFYGVTMEVFQELYTTSRSGDVKDVIANTIGSISAVPLLIGYYTWKKSK